MARSGLGANVGELGDGASPVRSDAPVRVTGLGWVKAIAAGGADAYALLPDGTVRAWGYNGDDELGDGAFVNGDVPLHSSRDVPVPVKGLAGVVAIAARGVDGYALKRDGTVWAWGFNTDGELGNGSSNDNSDVPVEVSGLRSVVAIAGGGTATVGKALGSQGDGYALRKDGTVWGWGYNGGNQLGGAVAYNYSDVPVRLPRLKGVKVIAAGAEDAYAIMHAR